ncbi:MAG: hypothetical protein ABR505_08035 [Actinomycetota bacterium]
MKRFAIALVCASLVAGMLQTLPANAQPEVPEVVQIEDPAGDANYVNDGTTFGAGGGRNHVGPMNQDLSGIGDLLKVWYTNDATTLSVHVQTEAPPPSSGVAYYTEIISNVDGDGNACVLIEYVIEAPTFQRDSYATVTDECAASDPVEGEVVVAEGPDGTGIATVTLPRASNVAFAPGSVLTAPEARVTNATGPLPDQVPMFGGGFVIYPIIDNTEPGTDYTLQDQRAKKCPKKKAKKGKCPKPAKSPSPTPTGSPVSPSPTATSAPVDDEAAGPWFVSRFWTATTRVWSSFVANW